ncbi:MAG: hypothetical protein Q4E24_02390 [bacterium]|nr:hypothetical protein [bacterium]
MNDILLRRRHKIWIERGTAAEPSERYLVTILKNIEGLGFTFSRELYELLRTFTVEELYGFYLELIPALKKLVGADVVYRPMYPNFPQSVMEEEYVQLIVNALVHYWTDGQYYPAEQKKERLPYVDVEKLTVLTVGTREDLTEIFYQLCQSKTSISDTDKEDLTWMFENLSGLTFPDEIPLKENAALIGMLYLEHNPLASAEAIQKYFKTATDVLRLVTAMSGGDLSLAANCRFRSFKRRERRILMDLLMGCGAIEEDMLRYQNRWIRVGERIHPGEYSPQKYQKVLTAFDKIRNNKEIVTFYSQVEGALKEKNTARALALLEKRPGELARRLDFLLRICQINMDGAQKDEILDVWEEKAHEVTSAVLLQVREHFKNRFESRNELRVFFPKGKLAYGICVPNTLSPLAEADCQRIVQSCETALKRQFSEKAPLGKTYLSEELRHYLIPFSQRSASKAAKTVARGSAFPIGEDAKAIRGFIWWTNTDKPSCQEESGGPVSNSRMKEESRVDLDLTAAIFDKNWKLKEYVSYTNLRSKTYRACHSGDIVNGGPKNGEGVAEFLDADIESVLKFGGRYIVYQVYSYTRQKFNTLDNCRFGWMEREDVNSGEIFEPKSVRQSMDLTAESTVAIPVIFDCLEKRVIWCDMNLSLSQTGRRFGNNIESNLSGVALAGYAMTHLKKPNLYDLISLHVQARGELVETKEEADTIFDVEEGITPFQTEYIQSELL